MKLAGNNKILAELLEGEDLSRGKIEVPSQQWRRRLRSAIYILIGVVIVFAIWWGFAEWFNSTGSATMRFPTPPETLARLGEYLFEGRSLYGRSIYEHIGASLGRLFAAFALSFLVGVGLGCIIGSASRRYAIGMVPVSVFQMIPGLAWLPIAILVFGLGNEAAVFIIFAVASMVIAAGVASAIRMVPPVLVNAAKMMGASDLRIFATVLIPQASVTIISSLRLGMSSALRVLIAAEMVVGTGIGIGYAIELTRDLLDYVGSFACIAAICVMGLAIDRLILAPIEHSVRRHLGLEEV